MRIPRIYYIGELKTGNTVILERQASQHVCTVLRLEIGAPLILFNGQGRSVNAILETSSGKAAQVRIVEQISENTESPLQLELGLGISKGDRMDYAIQKAVEVGVSRITPLITERTVVRLDDKRSEKKLAHWQGVIISSCEQSGRSVLPALDPVTKLDEWIEQGLPCKLVFDTDAKNSLSDLDQCKEVSILIGPEGGLSEGEISRAIANEFSPIKLGPRVLRSETAVVSACSALQLLWGDFG